MPHAEELISLLSANEKRQVGSRIARFYPDLRPYYLGKKAIDAESAKKRRTYYEKLKHVVQEVMLLSAAEVVSDIDLLQKIQWAIALASYGDFRFAAKLMDQVEEQALYLERFDMLTYLHQLKYTLFDERYAQADLKLPEMAYTDRMDWIQKNNSLMEKLSYYEYSIRSLIHKNYKSLNFETTFSWPAVLADPLPAWASSYAQVMYHLARSTYYFYYRDITACEGELKKLTTLVDSSPDFKLKHPKTNEHINRMRARIHFQYQDIAGQRTRLESQYDLADTAMAPERKKNLLAIIYIEEFIYEETAGHFYDSAFSVSVAQQFLDINKQVIRKGYRHLLLLNISLYFFRRDDFKNCLKTLGLLLRDPKKAIRADLFFYALYLRLFSLLNSGDDFEAKYVARYLQRNLIADHRYNELDELVLKPILAGTLPSVDISAYHKKMATMQLEHEYIYILLANWLESIQKDSG